jgi:hypothetical protein
MNDTQPGRFERFISWLIGPRLTVYCLAFLFVLTFWGTVYQVEHGLYAAQERFYNSWLILLGGFVPFPGTQLVLTVLTINLTAYLVAMVGRSSFGILLTHAGLLMLLLGGAVTHYFAEESQLTLMEGEASNVSASYHHWEVAVWKQNGLVRDVLAQDADALRAGDALRFEGAGLTVTVETYHRNARAFQATAAVTNAPVNALGITSLRSARLAKEPAENVAGGVFVVQPDGGDPVRVLLFGEDRSATNFTHAGAEWTLALRRVRTPLPFVVTLKDFIRELHPGTTMARAFSSEVEVSADGVDRALTISMNKPFRDRGYTLFQASYSEQPGQPQMSTFAVTKNYGRLIPYVSTGIIVLGMIWHFVTVLVRRTRRAA